MLSSMNRLAEFLRQERQALVGYVRRRIDDDASLEAEDIVQDVALHLFDRAAFESYVQRMGGKEEKPSEPDKKD